MTQSGTYWTGSSASIGTSTSCVGTAEPVPISKSILDASAYEATKTRSVKNPICRDEWDRTASATETTRKEAPSRREARRSRSPRGVAASWRDRSISASASTSPTRIAPLSSNGDPVATDVAISAVSASRRDSLTRGLNHPNGGSCPPGRGETEQSKWGRQLRLSEE